MRLALVLGLVGDLMRLFSAFFLAPLALSVYDKDWHSAWHFGASAVVTLLFGAYARRGYRETSVFYRDEALAVVALTWLFLGAFGGIPFLLAGLKPVDAIFESMSGFTTTGATVLTDFSRYSRSFFLWRAMTQWFGGLGVIALFVVVLPRLGIAGRQLFFAEASGAPAEAVSPKIRNSASRLWIVYTGLTVLAALSLMGAGMDVFDAILHALTTIAAGGFSPNPESVAGYHNAQVEWVLCGFMWLAGTSFTLQYKVFSGRPLGFFRDGEFLFYSSVMLVATAGLAVILAGGVPDLAAIRTSLFQVTSLTSSTGFASTDYNLWQDGARTILIIVMIVGGCAGSAAGGPKAVRLLLVFKHVLRELKQVRHPRAVLVIRYKNSPVPTEIMRAVFMLVVLYMVGHFLIGAVLVIAGSDLVLGFSAALACLGNIGPGFGVAGPMGSFAGFSDFGKLVLTFAMWVGRLEIVTVLALCHPNVWRGLRMR